METTANRSAGSRTETASTDYLCYRTNRDGGLCTTTVSSPGKACRVHRGKRRALSVRHDVDMPVAMPASVNTYFESPVYPHPEQAPA